MHGSVVYLFAFDVANEIETERVQELLSEKPFPFQIQVGSTMPRDVPLYRPLTIALKPQEVSSSVGPLTIQPLVKIFGVGAISITYVVRLEKKELRELLPFHQLWIGGTPLTTLAEQLCEQVVQNLKPYLGKPTTERPPAEAYTVFCITEPDAPRELPASDWVQSHRGEIAALLNEESIPDHLAESQIEETCSHSLSYTRDDVVVLDWDAALVVDRSGYHDDVLYVVELANVQLEEYRIFDDRLDGLFRRAYDDLERYYRARRLFATPERVLANLREIRMDITRMSEEVSNITKFVGDWYLARVYLACKDRFHLGHWETTVDQKLAELDRLYSLVRQEINERRMLLLEVVIVALFIIDLLAIFVWK